MPQVLNNYRVVLYSIKSWALWKIPLPSTGISDLTVYINNSQSVTCTQLFPLPSPLPTSWASLGNLLEKHMIDLRPDLLNEKPWKLIPSNLWFNKPSYWFWWMLKFEDHPFSQYLFIHWLTQTNQIYFHDHYASVYYGHYVKHQMFPHLWGRRN